MRARLFLIAVVASTAPAFAQVPALCSDSPTQADMNQCAAGKMAKADATLNKTYDQLMAKLDDNTKGMARDAQRAWLTFRDKECISRTGGGPNQGGTIWPAIFAECQTVLTEARTKDLAAQVKCPGGDLSCSP